MVNSLYEASRKELLVARLPREVVFRIAQDAANIIVRHAANPSIALSLPALARMPEGFVEEVRTKLEVMGPEFNLNVDWYADFKLVRPRGGRRSLGGSIARSKQDGATARFTCGSERYHVGLFQRSHKR